MPVVRPAVISVRTGAIVRRSVVTGTVVAVTGAVIRPVRCGRAGGDGAGGKTESEAWTKPARLCRGGHRGGADGGHRRQDCQCFFHAHLLITSIGGTTRRHCDGCGGSTGTGARPPEKIKEGRNEIAGRKFSRRVARGEGMEHPAGIFGCWRGFPLGRESFGTPPGEKGHRCRCGWKFCCKWSTMAA